MERRQFFDQTAYQYRIKALERELSSFKSGEQYVRMQEEHSRQIRSQERLIRDLKNELLKAHAETARVRNIWFDIMDDLDGEHRSEINKKDRYIRKLQERILEVERQRDQSMKATAAKSRSQHKRYYFLLRR